MSVLKFFLKIKNLNLITLYTNSIILIKILTRFFFSIKNLITFLLLIFITFVMFVVLYYEVCSLFKIIYDPYGSTIYLDGFGHNTDDYEYEYEDPDDKDPVTLKEEEYKEGVIPPNPQPHQWSIEYSYFYSISEAGFANVDGPPFYTKLGVIVQTPQAQYLDNLYIDYLRYYVGLTDSTIRDVLYHEDPIHARERRHRIQAIMQTWSSDSRYILYGCIAISLTVAYFLFNKY